ncbi:hypothetical protein DFH07DRAFT_765040 [Mycena maculata]|uniref:Uncharacterized protein n=1 Tax=Mycena maculata TaxID=230809 RepID=A0AAD7NZI0_9AGAR|nr:hypothetical protein DFH07DRAFT_765040 [Mycena maculata]
MYLNWRTTPEDFQARIKALTGTDFTININAAEVWAYAAADNTSAGTCFSAYVEGFISALQSFMEKFEDNGKTFFNEAVTQSELTLSVNLLGDKGETITSEVRDGVYHILFRHDRLGYNQSWLTDTMLPAIEAAPHEGFSLSAKNSIENDYDSEIDELREEINKLVGTEVTLDPNFEENYKALSGLKDKNWQQRFGQTVLKYFQGLKYQLERQGFAEDEMLQEGLQEIVETKTFKTNLERWGYNTNDMGEGLLKLL